MKCAHLENEARKNLNGVNIYNIYGTCWHGNGEDTPSINDLGFSLVGGQLKTYKKVWSQQQYTPWLKGIKETPPCVSGKWLLQFFNDANVRKALHVPDGHNAWDLCNDKDWF